MRNSRAIVDRLTERNVTTVFGIPGKQTLPLNDEIADREDVRFVMARHETNVTHQAWGYAESSGNTAATLVVPGPGDMNAMNGLKNALNDCTPLVHIAVETEPEVRGGDGIHETPPATYDTVVKENVTVESAEAAAPLLDRAITVAETPPKGPVRVGIPKNFVPMDTEPAAAERPGRSADPELPTAAIDRAAALLRTAESPVFVAGGGVRAANAADRLRSLAETAGAPVATTYKGKGTMPADHPLFAGALCAGTSTELRSCLEAADVLLAAGSDLDAVWTQQWSYDFPADLVHVTLDPSDVGTGYDPRVGIVADAGRALAAIEARLRDDGGPVREPTGRARARTVRRAEADRLADLRSAADPPIPTVSALDSLRDALPRETIVTADAGGSRVWTVVSFPTYEPRDYVNTGSWASMGLAVPAAVGAAVANPDRSVAAFTGEGGLLMCLEELHTLAAESLDVTVFVFHNDDYAIISEEAERTYDLDADEYRWAETPLDCARIAEGMGVTAVRAETPDAIREAATRSLGDGPVLVEIPTDPDEPQASEFMTR